MLNSNQIITQTIIDKRVLPTTGLITVRELFKFCESSWSLSSRIDAFAEKCEENHITIFKLLSDEPGTWLICLDDFKKMQIKD